MDFRLINTTTLKLEPFSGQSIPRYAILSHTWADEELLYAEMVSMNGAPFHPTWRKCGYIKVQGMCEKARSLGFEYAWVDTCCIDRSSSTELNEAINSMFHWYRRADVCLVYLSDLPPNSNIDDCMPRCRWFTRGWCLQELIAPQDVKFYNNCWQHIGNKSTSRLEQLISRITKIDKAVLSDASLLPTLSVAQRMSWASERVTTRPEDIAYCLLGIFEINMPMLYGEGEKAFLRLQEEIIKRSNDLSIFACGHPISTSPPNQAQYDQASIDEDGADSFATDPESCCDLFARCPGNFSGCGNIVLQSHGAFRNVEFSMTNNGLFFSRMDLRLDFNNCCYLLPLLCYDENSPSEPLYLTLKMVHSRLFVRLRQCPSRDLFIGDERVDGYVLTHITPPTRNHVASSHIKSVQLCSPLSSKSVLHVSLLEISPREIWDPSSLAFLNCDDRPFAGYCKLNGKRLCQAQSRLEGPECDCFYLAWGGLLLSDLRGTGRSRETVWVRLYPPEAWEGSSTLRGLVCIDADSNQASELEKHQLRLPYLNVEVGVVLIEKVDKIFFRIEIKASLI